MCEILLQILNAKTAARTLNHDLLIGWPQDDHGLEDHWMLDWRSSAQRVGARPLNQLLYTAT